MPQIGVKNEVKSIDWTLVIAHSRLDDTNRTKQAICHTFKLHVVQKFSAAKYVSMKASGDREMREVLLPHPITIENCVVNSLTLCALLNPHLPQWLLLFVCSKLQYAKNRLRPSCLIASIIFHGGNAKFAPLSDAKLLLTNYVFVGARHTAAHQPASIDRQHGQAVVGVSGRRKLCAPLAREINGSHWASRARRSNKNNKNNDNQLKHLADEFV